MQKRVPVFSPEGISINERLQTLHALYVEYGVYTDSNVAQVTIKWIEEPSFGPKLFRSLFAYPRRYNSTYRVHSANKNTVEGRPEALIVEDDTDGDPTIGAIAFYNPRSKDYDAFSFDRANVDDLKRVNSLVQAALTEAEQWQSLGYFKTHYFSTSEEVATERARRRSQRKS